MRYSDVKTYTEVTSKITGIAYYVVKALRGRCFYLTPKSNPAGKPMLMDRKDFTKPVVKEI